MDFLKIIDTYENEIIKSTQESIRIKSVEERPLPGMPFGQGPYKALEHILELGHEMGFEVKNLDGYAGHIEFGQGEETVGVLAHIDVVPEGDGWAYPPYGGEIHDGKIYGRGTTDDKGPAIASLYAMKALKESGIELNKNIRLIIGANEETGWKCMDHYFKNEKAPDMGFTPDANFPVIHGEKGIIIFDLVFKMNKPTDCDIYLRDLKGGNAPNMVPDYAEALLEVKNPESVEESLKEYNKDKEILLTISKDGNLLKLSVKGISAHGSTPEKGENAISHLMGFLGHLFDGGCSTCRFIDLYNQRIAYKHNGEGIGCGLEDDVSGKLNFNPGMIKIEDGKIVLTINIRYPIKTTSKEVYDRLRENLKYTTIEVVEGSKDSKPIYTPADDFLVEKLMSVYREMSGDEKTLPITIGGGTYARAMKNAVAFGPMFPGQKDVAHQKDEYIAIDHLMMITKIYAKALCELSK
ncbi:dipeptidase PepV [Tissierella creatinini]|nr:dipeptidase PepV [Tissierella creatinini]TJX63224.1 dipeptidase PepV [Soehngenia saccharolytica]